MTFNLFIFVSTFSSIATLYFEMTRTVSYAIVSTSSFNELHGSGFFLKKLLFAEVVNKVSDVYS